MERLIHKQMLFSQGRVAQFFFLGGGGLSVMFVVTESRPPPPPPSLPPSQMTAVSLVRAVIDDQFSLPKLTERLQNPGGYQYFVVEK